MRPARTGPLVLDADYDPDVLRHVSILKLAEEEARVLVGEPDEDALLSLGVPEVVLTLGSQGSLVLADGELERVAARAVGGESTRPARATPSSLRTSLRARPATRRPRRRGARRRSSRGLLGGGCVRALVRTVDGVFEVDLEDEEVLGLVDVPVEPPEVELVAAAARRRRGDAARPSSPSSTARPPLVVSNDAGRTWRESGGGLPPGRAVAIGDDNPDVVLYAARNRLYLSTDGGLFWRALVIELPEIEALELREA